MKKVILLSLLLLLWTTTIQAQTWVPTNQLSIGWDASQGWSDGTLEPGQLVQYKVYISKVGPNGNPGTPELKTTTSLLQATITFIEYGKFILGVSAIIISAGSEVSASEISWSNNPSVCQDGKAFGAVYRIVVSPSGLRIVTN